MPFEASKLVGFIWDAGNRTKSATRHQVTPEEAEEVFFNQPLLVAADAKHSQSEPRWHALGRTNEGRRLLIVFTTRGDRIRVISARPMSRKERTVYGKA